MVTNLDNVMNNEMQKERGGENQNMKVTFRRRGTYDDHFASM